MAYLISSEEEEYSWDLDDYNYSHEDSDNSASVLAIQTIEFPEVIEPEVTKMTDYDSILAELYNAIDELSDVPDVHVDVATTESIDTIVTIDSENDNRQYDTYD